MRAAFPVVAAAMLIACGQDRPQPSVVDPAVEEFVIDNETISESSGLARSHRTDDLLWTHNDSGGNAEVYALDTRGHYLGSLKVFPAINIDWEDMVSFIENGKPRLLLADIGDNSAIRPVLTLYIVDEPETGGLSAPFSVVAVPVRVISVRYPDGPRDAEAVAVDADEGMIYLLSKRDTVPQLYRLPLAPTVPLVIAEPLGTISIPRAAAGRDDADSFNFVTAMDIDDSGDQLILTTYLDAHVYARSGGQSWQQALQGTPRSYRLPGYSQIEACSFSADGGAVYISSENLPAPLARLALLQAPEAPEVQP